jgi:hypothetical protein
VRILDVFLCFPLRLLDCSDALAVIQYLEVLCFVPRSNNLLNNRNGNLRNGLEVAGLRK